MGAGMIDLLYNWSLALPDWLVVIACALIFGFAGIWISQLSHVLWFRRLGEFSEHEKKVGDGVQTGILALVAFFMALITTSELSSFASARSQVRIEALQITRIDRDLERLGPPGEKARSLLRQYVANVVDDEWTRLAMRPQSLSPAAEQRIGDLWTEIRAIQSQLQPAQSSLSDDLSTYMNKIDEARKSRLSAAINSIPDVVWIMITLLFLAACVLNGRNRLSRHARQVAFIHMSAFGLMLALNIIIDNPFGGDTSIDPAKISNALIR
jgi:hypothetical protein